MNPKISLKILFDGRAESRLLTLGRAGFLVSESTDGCE